MRTAISNLFKVQKISHVQSYSINKRYKKKKDIEKFKTIYPTEEELAIQTTVYDKSIPLDRFNFTPHQYWLTQGKGMERAFTGDQWFNQEVGHYECITCETKVFQFHQKFQTSTGFPSFWNHIQNNVEVADDIQDVHQTDINQINQKNSAQFKRCTCKNCGSHLGLVYYDGPPPTFLRYSVNSGALKFVEKEWWENPHIVKRRLLEKRKLAEEERQQKDYEDNFIVDKQ